MLEVENNRTTLENFWQFLINLNIKFPDDLGIYTREVKPV